MISSRFSKVSTLAWTSTLILAAGAAQALPVTLTGGAGDPVNAGFVPVPPNPPQPLTAADVANLSDGDLATGYRFSSSPGQYSSNAGSTAGFSVNFDFDVSQYESIDRIDFSWTGNYFWTGINTPNLWFGSDPGTATDVFGSPNDPGTTLTHTTSFIRGSTGFDNVDSVLHGNVASLFLNTELLFSSNGNLGLVTLDTFEISADVTGRLRDTPPVSVPEPGSFALFGAALSLMGLARRRSRRVI